MSEYIYNLTDFLNQAVYPDKLTYEINSADFGTSPAPVLSHINTTPTQCKLYFDRDLLESGSSPTELDILNSVIASHDGVAYTEADLPPYPEDGDIWRDPSTSLRYQYSDSTGKWLSIDRQNFILNGKGSFNSEYLAFGELKHAQIGYTCPRDLSIVSIVASASAGNATKGFSIEKNGSSFYDFSLTALSYKNTSIVLDFTEGDIITIFCKAAGDPINNVMVQLEISWRKE